VTDLPLAAREALGTFEALRRLGFASDDIYFQVVDGIANCTSCGGRREHMTVQLVCGDKRFVADCGHAEQSRPNEFRERFAEWACAWNEGDEEFLRSVWQEWLSRHGAAGIATALIEAGLLPPQERDD
jgi:hypothetical protein